MGWVPRIVAKHAVRDVRVHQLNLDALDKASDRVTMFTPDVDKRGRVRFAAPAW